MTIYVSDSYAPDDALTRRWARFLGGLVHGPELSGLTLYLAPPSEVARDCPGEAFGCYAPGSGQIEAIGDPSAGIPPEAVVAHEYGHYIASYRENTPWDAVAWGTKRWGSYEDVCARAAHGLAFPGDEGAHYALNPGEAFAETYRMLNVASAVVRWALVAPSFYPDAGALRSVREDVLQPWTGPKIRRLEGQRDYRLATPLDGPIELTAPAGLDLQARPLSGAPLHLTRAGRVLRGTICGARSLDVSLSRPAALVVSAP